jgi:hypothetical protein
MAAEYEKVSPYAIELGDLGKPSPFTEPEPPEESDAGDVVREDKPEQRGEA